MDTADRSGDCSIVSWVRPFTLCSSYKQQRVALIEQVTSPQWRGEQGEFETRPESHNVVLIMTANIYMV